MEEKGINSNESLQEAIQTVKELKTVSQENSRVISFSIEPLGNYCENFNRKLYELEKGELNKVLKIFDDFTKMQQKLNKLKDTQFAQEYPSYNDMLVDIGKSLLVNS